MERRTTGRRLRELPVRAAAAAVAASTAKSTNIRTSSASAPDGKGSATPKSRPEVAISARPPSKRQRRTVLLEDSASDGGTGDELESKDDTTSRRTSPRMKLAKSRSFNVAEALPTKVLPIHTKTKVARSRPDASPAAAPTSPATTSTTKNAPSPCKTPSGHTRIAPPGSLPASQSKAVTPRTPTLRLLQDAKAAFRRCATPQRLVGRELERETIRRFLTDHAVAGAPGALYISGCPGTGKTALVDETLRSLQDDMDAAKHPVSVVKINCMSVSEPRAVLARMLSGLGCDKTPAKDAIKALQEVLIQSSSNAFAKSPICLVVLDEIDTVAASGGQEMLYQLFVWAAQPKSRLVLIGIANAVDLMSRFLPRLRTKNCEPEMLNFNPYKVSEVAAILRERFALITSAESTGIQDPPTPTSRARAALRTMTTHNTEEKKDVAMKPPLPLIQPMAIEFAARKVADTGDLRKALDVCRHAIELAENEERKQLVAKSATSSPMPPSVQDKSNAQGSSDKPQMASLPVSVPVPVAPKAMQVTIGHVARAAASLLDGRASSRIKDLHTQHKVVLCALLVMMREGFTDMSVGSVHATYVALCTYDKLTVPVSRTEFDDLISLLEMQALVSVSGKANLHSRKSKSLRICESVSLSVKPQEVEQAAAASPLLTKLLANSEKAMKNRR